MRIGRHCAVYGTLLSIAAAAHASGSQGDEKLFSRQELRTDLAQMYRGLKAAHFNLYAFTPKRELDRRYAQVRDHIDRPMTMLQAKVLFESFAAAVRMGHTRVDSPTAEWNAYRENGGAGFPLSIRIADERVYVAENLSGLSTIGPGDEILGLNG